MANTILKLKYLQMYGTYCTYKKHKRYKNTTNVFQ